MPPIDRDGPIRAARDLPEGVAQGAAKGVLPDGRVRRSTSDTLMP
jgi:hypothetical protein